MSAHKHRATQQRIGSLFVTGLTPPKRSQLFEEVDGCDVCAGYYRRYQLMEDALTGCVGGVSPFARERVLEVVLGTIPPSVESRRNPFAWRVRAAFGVAALAASGAVVLLLLPMKALPSHRSALSDEASLAPVEVISAKGSPAREAADIGIRVFQVAKNSNEIAEKNDLILNDILTFTYTFDRPGDGYLTLFGFQKSGDIRWYYPDYGEAKSIRIKGDSVDEPLGDGIDLSVNHTSGWLRIVAIFSHRPIDVSAVETGVDAARQSGGDARFSDVFTNIEYGAPFSLYSVIMKIEEKK